MQPKLLRPSWTTPAAVLCGWIPSAYGLFLIGFLVSLFLFFEGRSATLEDAIVSDVLSPDDNPRGYLVAAAAVSACGLLLLPAADLFQRGWDQRCRRWSVTGAWLYRIGLTAMVAIGATTPFQEPYVPVHIGLAFVALMGMVAGLAVCLGVAACSSTSFRVPLAVLSFLQIGALLFLAILVIFPSGFLDRRFLALFEWLLNALIAAGTVSVAAALNVASNQAGRNHGGWGGR